MTEATSDRWVWRTALGRPVVPELNGYAESASSAVSGNGAGRCPSVPNTRSQNDSHPGGASSSTQMRVRGRAGGVEHLGQRGVGHDDVGVR